MTKSNIVKVDKTTTANTTYIVQENERGDWLVMRMVESGSDKTFTYANKTNNPTVLTTAAAVAAIDSLTYGNFSAVF